MTSSPSSRLIDPSLLDSLLGPASARFVVDALAECPSTSSVLLERARQGIRSGTLVVADRQTAGRGRRGRSWQSSAEASLTFSLLWRFPGGVSRLAGLSLAVGVAVARALIACGVGGVGLKWPNDILLDEGKVGGILVELESEPGGMLAVIGIGLNLDLPPPGDEPFIYPPAALAQALSPLPDRHQILARLLVELAGVLDRFAEGGFGVVRDEWQANHAWQNRVVRLFDGGRAERDGICLGIDTDGALLLRTAAGVERCLAGDLTLRSA